MPSKTKRLKKKTKKKAKKSTKTASILKYKNDYLAGY